MDDDEDPAVLDAAEGEIEEEVKATAKRFKAEKAIQNEPHL